MGVARVPLIQQNDDNNLISVFLFLLLQRHGGANIRVTSSCSHKSCQRSLRRRQQKGYNTYASGRAMTTTTSSVGGHPSHIIQKRCTFDESTTTGGGGGGNCSSSGRHVKCQRESSNSSNTSSVRIIEYIC